MQPQVSANSVITSIQLWFKYVSMIIILWKFKPLIESFSLLCVGMERGEASGGGGQGERETLPRFMILMNKNPIRLPSKQETLTRYWVNAGPASQTMGQH